MYKYTAIALALIAVFYAHDSYAQDAPTNMEVKILKGSSNESLAKSFYPEILPINPEESITWTNEDSVAHSIASGVPAHPDYSGEYFATGSIKPSKSATVKIDNPVYFAYYYFCEIHPWLEGKIVLANAPESHPETESAVITDTHYDKGQDVVITGQVVEDFAEIPYNILVYQHPNKLVDIVHGKFTDASYAQTISTDNMDAGIYTLKVVYGLPTQIGTATFELGASQSPAIPQWIKENAEWWADGKISDAEFIDSIEYLAKEKIITIKKTSSAGQSETIPAWIRTTASWWSDGSITDDEFARGLEYLANSGIIRI
ncbi:MAG: cupredoxin domain-containing protein [Nitrososphaerota archaeon]